MEQRIIAKKHNVNHGKILCMLERKGIDLRNGKEAWSIRKRGIKYENN